MLHDPRLRQLQSLHEERPRDPEVLLELTRAYNARNAWTRASEAAAALLEIDPEHETAWHEAVIAASFDEGDELERLREQLARQVAERPDQARAHRDLALACYYLEHDDEAREASERAIALRPEDARAHEVRAFLAYTVGNLDQAIESAIHAVELDGESYRALHLLGQCYSRLDAPAQAERYLHRALEIEPSFFLALEALLSSSVKDPDRWQETLQCHARIVAVDPCFFPIHFRLADALMASDRLLEAAALAESVLRLDPDPATEADAHQYLGVIHLMREELDESRQHLERVLDLDRRSAGGHHYLGVVSEREGDATGAERLFRRALHLAPDFADPHVHLGYIAFDRKEYESARRHFEAALESDDEKYLAHLGLGELARWRRRYEQQLEHCRRAAEIAPEDSNVQNQLATAHDALGHLEEAVEHYETALRLDPWNRQAANNLGYLWEKQLKSCDEESAGEIRERAVAAWRRRLLICRDTGSSTRGAKNHLSRLGVSADEIREWLATAVVA